MSKTIITARIRPDGKVVRVSSGKEARFPSTRQRRLSASQAAAAAVADPDSRPMTPAELRDAKRVPRVKTLRRALQLTQEQFSERYEIPLGTLRDWEQGRSKPDQPALAYLKIIARDPQRVFEILHAISA